MRSVVDRNVVMRRMTVVGCVDPRGGLNALEKREIPSNREQNSTFRFHGCEAGSVDRYRIPSVCLCVSLLTAEGQAGRPAVSCDLCDVLRWLFYRNAIFTVLLPDPKDISSSAIVKF